MKKATLERTLVHVRNAETQLALAGEQLLDSSYEMLPAIRSTRERLRAIEAWIEDDVKKAQS